MPWKVAIVRPAGIVYKDSNAFALLYSISKREETEKHAERLRTIGMTVGIIHAHR